VLQGRAVRLEPLGRQHLEPLLAAAGESRASYGLTTVPADRDAMAAYIETALTTDCVPFATVWHDRVVGSTRFGNLERWNGEDLAAVEIGWTWLAVSAQRTEVNTQAKILMLDHAFGVWGVKRVTLKTDARNARSRAAIERIGGRLDGVLRAHMPAADGGVRDSAVYSILAAEWPAHRARLLDTVAPNP
jgi:RimJ/RimL family protein N-acetyltransferase